ncbi:MAG: DUF4296 domain-containing protein [Bacteroidales bacterium]|nr:DUF4296 domain-containing protein [Bacteroidales bacterium]
MNKLLFILIIGFAIAGCSNENKEGFQSAPPGIISRDSMVDVLVDIQLVESALKVKHRRVDQAQYYARIYYDSIFKKHHITYPKFDSSLKYYQQHELKELEAIYEDVIERLNKMKGRIKSE